MRARGKAAEEGTARDADGKQAAEEHHCVDTRASLLGPVHVLEVEPERELIERQRRGTAVEDGREFRQSVIRAVLVLRVSSPGRPSVVRLLRRVDLQQPEIARAEEACDPDDEMVEMAPADSEVVKRPDAVLDGVRDRAGRRERREK